MTDQNLLFRNTEERTASKPERVDSRPLVHEGECPKSWKAMMFMEREGTGCLTCKGTIDGNGGPPSEELIVETVNGLGWKVDRIREMGPGSSYPYFVHVVCDGSSS